MSGLLPPVPKDGLPGPPESMVHDPPQPPADEDQLSPRPPSAELERIGPSYRVTVGGLRLTFREVRTDRELAADVAVAYGGRHLFRTTSTLSLTTRDKLAKTAAELAGVSSGDAKERMRRDVFEAVELVLAAEERIGQAIDLRTAPLTLPAGGLHVARPLWPAGSLLLVSPGDAGKSTLARALAVSLASGHEVIPGIIPVGDPRPVLYVAAEDPVAHWHARSLEAVCRGMGIERAALPQSVELFDARGRPLHRIARSLAERAASYGAVILDSQQALLAQVDVGGGIRDRDSLFWHAVDQSAAPVLIIAHPNRADSRNWQSADGRVAGSEVNRDRARMAWRMTWKDEPAVLGTSFRRYTLVNVKSSHGPKQPMLGFAAAWQYGVDGDPGTLRFSASEPDATADPAGLTPVEIATLHAYRAGADTPAALAEACQISQATAKKRLQRLRGKLGQAMEGKA